MQAPVWILAPLASVCSALAADATPHEKLTASAEQAAAHARIVEWVAKLGADSWTERESATQALQADGQAATRRLEVLVRETDDPEVRARTEKILAVLRLASVNGTYKQVSIKTKDALGNDREDGTDKKGTLIIEQGTVAWTLHLDGNGTTTQTYTVAVQRPLRFEDEIEVPLVFQDMQTNIGYSPEAENPRLRFKRTPTGIKAIFTGTDGMQHTSTVEFEAQDQK